MNTPNEPQGLSLENLYDALEEVNAPGAQLLMWDGRNPSHPGSSLWRGLDILRSSEGSNTLTVGAFLADCREVFANHQKAERLTYGLTPSYNPITALHVVAHPGMDPRRGGDAIKTIYIETQYPFGGATFLENTPDVHAGSGVWTDDETGRRLEPVAVRSGDGPWDSHGTATKASDRVLFYVASPGHDFDRSFQPHACSLYQFWMMLNDQTTYYFDLGGVPDGKPQLEPEILRKMEDLGLKSAARYGARRASIASDPVARGSMVRDRLAQFLEGSSFEQKPEPKPEPVLFVGDHHKIGGEVREIVAQGSKGDSLFSPWDAAYGSEVTKDTVLYEVGSTEQIHSCSTEAFLQWMADGRHRHGDRRPAREDFEAWESALGRCPTSPAKYAGSK